MSYLLNCANSNVAMELLNELKADGVKTRVVPTPSAIVDGCGLSLIIMDEDLKKIDKKSDKFVAYQIEKDNTKVSYIKI